MKHLKRCTVVSDDRKIRCNRLATKVIEHQRICSRHYREFKNEILVEHSLGRSESEKLASMAKALQEDDDPASLSLLKELKL